MPSPNLINKDPKSRTIKPADINLGIDTDDYIQQLMLSCTLWPKYVQINITTPTQDIEHQLQETTRHFSPQLNAIHKNLKKCSLPNPKNTQPLKFYGIPKIHKICTTLPRYDQQFPILIPCSPLLPTSWITYYNHSHALTQITYKTKVYLRWVRPWKLCGKSWLHLCFM